MCTSSVLADDEFTPLNFSDATYTSGTQAYNTVVAVSTNSQQEVTTPSISQSTGSSKMQSAISQLDSAQIEVRNELLKYKAQYAEIDAQYKKVKDERANLAKQVKACEKKIKQLDNAKEKIRKNML